MEAKVKAELWEVGPHTELWWAEGKVFIAITAEVPLMGMNPLMAQKSVLEKLLPKIQQVIDNEL